MPEFKIIHRTFLESNKKDTERCWQTCQRKIYFFDHCEDSAHFHLIPSDEIYYGLDADIFLAEVLCGLKSSLIGETEVFGQFKNWWKELSPTDPFRQKFQGKTEALFALVKMVREKVLCGQGSQSYGSLLRKYLLAGDEIEVIGAGHLVSEILPWIQNKSAYRIWSRDPAKTQSQFKNSVNLPMTEILTLSKTVVIAAPISHTDLNQWLQQRNFSSHHRLIDFRADSANFECFVQPLQHLKLQDFSSRFEADRAAIEKKVIDSRALIQQWRQAQESKSQMRPYGWDDL